MKRPFLPLPPAAALLCAAALVSPAFAQETAAPAARTEATPGNSLEKQRHVLLISVDGLHALDLDNYVAGHPDSTLARLSRNGTTYPLASTSRPSDSFPGLLSMVTGGSPRTTGVFYDASYDRQLAAAPGAPAGTTVTYDESIDKDPTALDGGGGIDPAKLPVDPAKGNAPVYPHSFLRVNTIFEVVRQAGGRTAWSDKHPAYDLVNGPSGKGVDDLYNPEIAAVPVTVEATQPYDALKVQAVLNEIAGRDHTGQQTVGVPNLFGMNFQAVSVAQKTPTGGYLDTVGTPSAPLTSSLDFVDRSLGQMVGALSDRGLLGRTAIIITAKHGQSPVDRSKLQLIRDSLITDAIEGVAAGLTGQVTADDVALIWLTDQSKTGAVVAALNNVPALQVGEILSGPSLQLFYNSPALDSRSPDIVVLPRPGVVYAGKNAVQNVTKIAEHGGFNFDDTNVALLVSNPRLPAKRVTAPVQTTQIAPTILEYLGLRASLLKAVATERTTPLPGFSRPFLPGMPGLAQ